MRTVVAVHMRLGVAYVLLGMLLGLHMAISDDHSLFPAHAHLNLVGFVLTFLYGLFLRPFAAERAGWLEWLQLVFAHLGVIVLTPGLLLIYSGRPEAGDPLASAGSMAALIGMLLFAVLVFRRTGRGVRQSP